MWPSVISRGAFPQPVTLFFMTSAVAVVCASVSWRAVRSALSNAHDSDPGALHPIFVKAS